MSKSLLSTFKRLFIYAVNQRAKMTTFFLAVQEIVNKQNPECKSVGASKNAKYFRSLATLPTASKTVTLIVYCARTNSM